MDASRHHRGSCNPLDGSEPLNTVPDDLIIAFKVLCNAAKSDKARLQQLEVDVARLSHRAEAAERECRELQEKLSRAQGSKARADDELMMQMIQQTEGHEEEVARLQQQLKQRSMEAAMQRQEVERLRQQVQQAEGTAKRAADFAADIRQALAAHVRMGQQLLTQLYPTSQPEGPVSDNNKALAPPPPQLHGGLPSFTSGAAPYSLPSSPAADSHKLLTSCSSFGNPLFLQQATPSADGGGAGALGGSGAGAKARASLAGWVDPQGAELRQQAAGFNCMLVSCALQGQTGPVACSKAAGAQAAPAGKGLHAPGALPPPAVPQPAAPRGMAPAPATAPDLPFIQDGILIDRQASRQCSNSKAHTQQQRQRVEPESQQWRQQPLQMQHHRRGSAAYNATAFEPPRSSVVESKLTSSAMPRAASIYQQLLAQSARQKQQKMQSKQQQQLQLLDRRGDGSAKQRSARQPLIPAFRQPQLPNSYGGSSVRSGRRASDADSRVFSPNSSCRVSTASSSAGAPSATGWMH